MGNVQKALEHIESTKERVKRESLLMNSLGPDLYGWLRYLDLKIQAAGGDADVEAPRGLDYRDWRPCSHLEKAVEDVSCWMIKRGCARLRLRPSLDNGRQIVAIESLERCPCVEDLEADAAGYPRQDVLVRVGESCGCPCVFVESPIRR